MCVLGSARWPLVINQMSHLVAKNCRLILQMCRVIRIIRSVNKRAPSAKCPINIHIGRDTSATHISWHRDSLLASINQLRISKVPTVCVAGRGRQTEDLMMLRHQRQMNRARANAPSATIRSAVCVRRRHCTWPTQSTQAHTHTYIYALPGAQILNLCAVEATSISVKPFVPIMRWVGGRTHFILGHRTLFLSA